MERYIVAVNDREINPTVYGPFDGIRGARVWAEKEMKDGGVIEEEDWTVIVLNLP